MAKPRLVISFIVPEFLSRPDRLKEGGVQFRRIPALKVRRSCNRNPSIEQCLGKALLRAARGLDSSNQLASGRFRCKLPESYALIATPGLVDELAEPVKTRGHLLPSGGEFVPESRLRKVENTCRVCIAELKHLAKKQSDLFRGVQCPANACKAEGDVFFYFVSEIRLAHHSG